MHKETMGTRYIEVTPRCTSYKLEASADGTGWQLLKSATTADYSHDLVVLESPVLFRYIRVSGMQMPYGGLPAVSGLRVFGKGNGQPPTPVEQFHASRQKDGTISLDWEPSLKADGYNIRYGTQEDKLYSSWQIYGENKLDLTMINTNAGYFISVDSFNENGVAAGMVQWVP